MKKNSKLISLLLAVVLILGAVYIFSGKDTGAVIDTAASIAETLIDDSSETAAPAASQNNAAADTDAEELDGTNPDAIESPLPVEEDADEAAIDENGSYTSKEDVALYIHTYGHLPGNFVTKKEAEAAGWSGGSLEKYFPGKSIGGSRFGNHEGLLPDAPGRKWTECDINTLGKSSRGAERIVFSNDGLIYYTGDHYKSFEQLY